MTDHHRQTQASIEIQGARVFVDVTRRQGARRATLRLSAGQDRLLLTLPPRMALERGLAFVAEKTGWVAERLAKAPLFCPLREGSVVPVLGVPHRIVQREGRGVTGAQEMNEEALLVVYGDPAFAKRRIGAYLAARLKAECVAESGRLAARIGEKVTSVTVRSLASRWGSCTRSGHLSFALQLVFAPRFALDYVIAHETAHLREMHHRPSFWALVAELCPDYETARDWLKAHGAELHRYG